MTPLLTAEFLRELYKNAKLTCRDVGDRPRLLEKRKQKMGFSGVGMGTLYLLHRIGLVVTPDGQDLWCEENTRAAWRLCEAIACLTGRATSYVESVLSTNGSWDRSMALSRARGVRINCVGDGPRCHRCRHQSYCVRQGVRELFEDREANWITLYPLIQDILAEHRTVLGNLPSEISGIVVRAMKAEHFYRSSWSVSEKRLASVRAAYIEVDEKQLSDMYSRYGLAHQPPRVIPNEDMEDMDKFSLDSLPNLLQPDSHIFLRSDDARLLAQLHRHEHRIRLLAIDWAQAWDRVTGQEK